MGKRSRFAFACLLSALATASSGCFSSSGEGPASGAGLANPSRDTGGGGLTVPGPSNAASQGDRAKQ